MTADEFLDQLAEGRRDFSGESLPGQNVFVSVLRRSHPESFSSDLADLIRESAPVTKRPLRGISAADTDFARCHLVDSNFHRSTLTRANFAEADARFVRLARANLRGTNFTGADLRHANLNYCDLTGANFTGAKLDHSSSEHAQFAEAQFAETSSTGANFSRANFEGASIEASDLNEARFVASHFSRAIVSRSSLRRSTITGAIFLDSRVEHCDLSNSALREVRWTRSTIANVNLTGALLRDLIFEKCEVSSAQLAQSSLVGGKIVDSLFQSVGFERARIHAVQMQASRLLSPILEHTALTDIDLHPFIDSEPRHNGPSSVDYLSVARTMREQPAHPLQLAPHPGLQKFLERCGVPAVSAMYLIDTIRALEPGTLRTLMQSTFISYGTPDQSFAKRLNADLSKNGVTTFFFPLDAPFGEKLHATMRRVDNFDRVILICSRESLHRKGVQYEMEKVIEREAREGGASLLIPVAIDDFIFGDWTPARPSLRQELLNRVVADFRDPSLYDEQFSRLLRALKKSSVP